MYMLVIVTARKRSWGKVILSEACVKNSVHGGGLAHCMLGYTPHPTRRRAPDQEQTHTPGPGEAPPPWNRHPPPPGDTGNKPVLECNLIKIITDRSAFA